MENRVVCFRSIESIVSGNKTVSMGYILSNLLCLKSNILEDKGGTTDLISHLLYLQLNFQETS